MLTGVALCTFNGALVCTHRSESSLSICHAIPATTRHAKNIMPITNGASAHVLIKLQPHPSQKPNRPARPNTNSFAGAIMTLLAALKRIILHDVPRIVVLVAVARLGAPNSCIQSIADAHEPTAQPAIRA